MMRLDYLGSITQITNNSGNLVAEYSYDAWGRMRNPVDWTLYTQSQLLQLPMPFGNRGYTGHEQLNQFGLINMNARLYDPLLARFLAPDPQVSAPETSNGFNRFIYASNNPLMYTDPNGEQSVREFNPYWYLFPHSNLGGSHSSGPNSGSSGAGFNTGNAGTGPSAVGYQDYNSGFSNGNGGGIPDGSLNGVPGLILYGIDLLFNHNPDPRYLPHNVTYSAAVVQNANTKPINLSKPVGTGASMVYSGGGNKKSQGNSNSSWINEAQYGIPVWGSCLQSSEALNKGDFLNAACFFGLGFFEAFTLGEGTEVRLGINATKESITTIEKVAVHGNSLKSLKPTWGYKLFSEDGTFLKNGITSKLVPQSRYTRVFMKGKYLEPFKQFPNRLEAWQWEYQQNLIQRGPLNLNMH